MALIPVAGAGLSYLSLTKQGAAQESAMRAKSGQTYLERINGLVYAIVMDSRGIYMSNDWAAAEGYGKGLLKSAKELDEVTKLWGGTVAPDQQDGFKDAETTIGQFIGFRTELVRLAREDSLPAARSFGDNDANRSNRKALNEKLRALSSHYETYVASTTATADEAGKTTLNLSAITGILSVLSMIAGIWLVITNLA